MGLEKLGFPAMQTLVITLFYSIFLLVWILLLIYSIGQFWR